MLSYLDELESEAIYIMREVAGQCRNPALLFSGGKDSVCLAHLALKAFRPARIPFPFVHIDTGHNYEAVTQFRDRFISEIGERLIVRSLEDSISRGTISLPSKQTPRNPFQSVTLLETIEEFQFDACIGGARRDEEKSRAKERIFSFRDSFGQWDPKNQRPELWELYNAKIQPGENIRVFPISNWTELDVWLYIAREKIKLPSIYFAHMREVVKKSGFLKPVTALTPMQKGECSEEISVRFRTVGDITCTAPVASTATTVNEIILETANAKSSERGATRLDDQVSEAAMEKRKKEGYF